MKDNTVTCDNCKADITCTTNSIGYRIELRSERIPSRRGIVTDMWIEPELDHTHHFCAMRCLKLWLASRVG